MECLGREERADDELLLVGVNVSSGLRTRFIDITIQVVTGRVASSDILPRSMAIVME
jgi:hypothetical protein